MKKLVVLMSVMLIIAIASPVSAASTDTSDATTGPEKAVYVDMVPLNPIAENVNRVEDAYVCVENASQYVTRSSFVEVHVNVPCDEEWRSQTDWQLLAFTAVENADDLYFGSFGINFIVNAYQNWSSNNSNLDSALLTEVISECGKNGQDHMIAFTKQTGNSAAGWGRIGQPYALVINTSVSGNKKVARHEIGHTYGMGHCSSESSQCFMNKTALFYSYFDTLCSTHTTYMTNNWNKYGS